MRIVETGIKTALTYKCVVVVAESPAYWLAYSTHDWKVVGSNLIQYNILDGNGVKARPG